MRAPAACALAILVLSLIPSPFLVNLASGFTPQYTVVYNPYAGVDWNTTLRLKTQLHAHTNLGGGGSPPQNVINNYAAAGFDALGISDYNQLTWPWTTWEEYLTPAAKNMVAIPNDEVALSNVHFVTPFITASLDGRQYNTSAQGAIDATIAVGGIPFVAHPELMGFELTTCDRWTGFRGIDIYNPTEKGIQPFDFQLWDHLLTDPARVDKHIWGLAVDDSHDTVDINQGWIVVFAAQRNATSVKDSIVAGSFVAVVNSTNSISNITQVGNTLRVDASSSVVWKADGQQIVGTGSALNLDTLGPGYTYVRAEVGDREIFTQPIFIKQTSPNVIFSSGFEDGFTSWTNLVVQTGTVAQSSDTAHSGLSSAKITGIQYEGDKAYANKSLGASYKRVDVRAYVNFSSNPTAGVMMGPLSLSSSVYYAAVVVRNFASNRWGVMTFNPLTGLETYHWENGTSAIMINKWDCIELEAVMSVNGFATLWIDGVMKLNVTNVNFYSSTVTSVGAGICEILNNLSTVLKLYVDDVVVSDSYIGPITQKHALTVGVSGHGTTNATGTFLHDANTNVIVLATPDVGCHLGYWLRNGTNVGTANPYTINMTADYNLTAVFAQTQYSLVISAVGNGSVTRNNTGPYFYGDSVKLTAVPSAGWTFSGWSGDLTGSVNPAVILMDNDKTVTSSFNQQNYSLTLSVAPEGSGSITLNATEPYRYGDVVELRAVPDPGWRFGIWSGDLSGSTNPATVMMNSNRSVTAIFVQDEYSLTMTASPPGGGSVSLNNTGPYHYGDLVQLTALPTVGWAFIDWAGDFLGSSNPAVIAVNGNKTITANFVHLEYVLTVVASPVEGGSVTRNWTGPYHYGDWVRLTALANAQWSFSQWSGDASGINSQVDVFIDGNKSATAGFTRTQRILTVGVSGHGSTNATGAVTHDAFTNVTVLAIPDSGWNLDHWVLNATEVYGIDTFTLNMTANYNLTAVFAPPKAYLVVRGDDDRIYYRGYNPTSLSWTSWSVIPNGWTPDSPAATLCSDTLYVVVRGEDNRSLYFESINLTDNSFSGWTLLSGATPSTPTLTTNGTTLALVVRGEDERIYYRFYDIASQTWTEWTALPSGWTPDQPAATVQANQLQVIVRGMDGSSIWHSSVNLTDGTFSGWVQQSGSTPSAPTLASNSTTLSLIVRGDDDRIYYRFYNINSQTWTDWNALPSGTTRASPSATIADSSLQIIVQGSEGVTLYHSYLNLTDEAFSGWTLLSGSTPSAPKLAG